MDHMGGLNGGAHLVFMGFFWIVVVGGLVLLVLWTLARWGRSRRKDLEDGGDKELTLEALKQQYAIGEINGEEYRQLMSSLIREG